MSTIDISSIILLDNHAHPFPSGRGEKMPYERNFTLTRMPITLENVRHTLVFQMLSRRLRRFLELPEDCTIEEMDAVRRSRLREDRKGYINALWKDAGYGGMIEDIGSPITKQLLNGEELAEFDQDMEGLFCKKVNRLEWVAEDVIESGTHSFEEFTQLYMEGIRSKVAREHLIGLKSIIAYKTGLDVKVLSEKKFREQYYLYLSDPKNRAYEKSFRDYCFCKGCEVAAELDIPLQIHTALGDAPDIDLVNANPAQLYEAVNAFQDTKFVLIHAGYPYCEELGFMMASYDNVYGDISSMMPYASVAGETKLSAIMELAPLNKLMFGTDAGSTPEQNWYGAIEFRMYLQQVLQHLVDRDYVSESFAMEAAENIMYRNLLKLYKLSDEDLKLIKWT